MASIIKTPLPSANGVTGPYAPLRELPPLPVKWRSLPRALVTQARARWSSEAMADSTGARLTYGKTLISALALGRRSLEPGGPRNTSAY